MTDSERSPNGGGRTPDLSHVKGQEAAKRALEVAAAGEHPILLIGPAGPGKTLLARCLPGLLPPPTREEAAEIAETHRRAKLDPPAGRPFREPHFRTRPLDLVGRGRKPGEVDLARGGALFLDNLPAFGKRSRRALREALETGGGREAGLDTGSTASFLLVAAMRPCPCGHLHDPRHDCSCAPWEVARYWRPIEEFFLDLVHLHVEVPAIGLPELRSRAGEATREVAERVRAARERQLARSGEPTLNAYLRPPYPGDGTRRRASRRGPALPGPTAGGIGGCFGRPGAPRRIESHPDSSIYYDADTVVLYQGNTYDRSTWSPAT